jgi:hypothetical protein
MADELSAAHLASPVVRDHLQQYEPYCGNEPAVVLLYGHSISKRERDTSHIVDNRRGQ